MKQGVLNHSVFDLPGDASYCGFTDLIRLGDVEVGAVFAPVSRNDEVIDGGT